MSHIHCRYFRLCPSILTNCVASYRYFNRTTWNRFLSYTFLQTFKRLYPLLLLYHSFLFPARTTFVLQSFLVHETIQTSWSNYHGSHIMLAVHKNCSHLHPLFETNCVLNWSSTVQPIDVFTFEWGCTQSNSIPLANWGLKLCREWYINNPL